MLRPCELTSLFTTTSLKQGFEVGLTRIVSTSCSKSTCTGARRVAEPFDNKLCNPSFQLGRERPHLGLLPPHSRNAPMRNIVAAALAFAALGINSALAADAVVAPQASAIGMP